MEILSQLWSLLGLLTVLQNVLPSQLLSLLHSLYESLQDLLSPYSYLEIPEFNGYCGVDVNDLYRHVNLYLNAVDPSASSCRRLTALLSRSNSSINNNNNTNNRHGFSFAVAPNHSVRDAFCGHTLTWTHHVEAVPESLEERRSFVLKLPKRHRQTLLSPYLDHVISRSEEFERVSRERRLFTNNGHGSYDSGWVSVPFRHPSTFETLALETQLKNQITQDLTSFANGKDFYHRVGRAWKRGYLLYGPPGSGKSSLIAAMANYLCYDVYDLELTKVSDNSELRALLIQTTNRSIIVIEDIDCTVDLTTDRAAVSSKPGRKRSSSSQPSDHHDQGQDQSGRVTLSGLLNFTDGLWSCCGEERIIVFTTNHKDNVDPALLRCGRMDVHVSLGTCGPAAFRVLVRNYLGLEMDETEEEEEHRRLMEAAEECLRSSGALTPAQIGEILLRNRSDAAAAMREVVAAMQAAGRMAAAGGGNRDQVKELYCHEHEAVAAGRLSPESVLMRGSPENWVSSSPGKKKKIKFLVRLRSLTKSDSGRRGV
ncbi:putative mitochondrial chaperone bcs1 [Morus notabilis]|uniref:Putative mitochondrial chaperone bcs1 n=1 Tax=Morus notabilis TaxID=981085 RepID=W9RWK5_9ROSA|nr:AAA-ATPase At4g30250 [Morus notabilis]EXB75451.1 putative mitochondrial chaperone bcs1 [Morus notabilis]